ncbi:hypothetical protein niasHT_030074 [Heterodera trifolii]|uniref:Transposase n=1 Tax=Heterodera trifolii TaxID=157864 RepID=A0ABD2JQI3_9BILA
MIGDVLTNSQLDHSGLRYQVPQIYPGAFHAIPKPERKNMGASFIRMPWCLTADFFAIVLWLVGKCFEIFGFVYLWARGVSLKNLGHELELSQKTAVDWASFCREVFLKTFIDDPMKLGGIGKTVEIDESKFGKRKYWRGHRVDGCWVFGGIERESGRIFMEIVEKDDIEFLAREPVTRVDAKPVARARARVESDTGYTGFFSPAKLRFF